MVNKFYTEYLLYLVGNLKEGKQKNCPNNIFWVGDKIGTVFELEINNRFWVRTQVFEGFSNFFGLDRYQSMDVLKIIIEELLDLSNLDIYNAAHLVLPKFNENIEIIE